MAVTEELELRDKNIYPEEELIFSIIGDKKTIWGKILAYAHENFKDINEEWRYYNDGKQWLFKLTQNKKTIFWLALLKDTFIITFYFGDKAEPWILGSQLPQSVKDEFVSAKRYGRLRAISTKITGNNDIVRICKLIDIKLKMK